MLKKKKARKKISKSRPTKKRRKRTTKGKRQKVKISKVKRAKKKNKAKRTNPKKVVLKRKKIKPIKEVLIGRVTHYFGKIKVAAIKLSKSLEQGDQIHFVGGEKTNFKQKVISLEINHKRIKKAPKGSEVGIKVRQVVREGYRVYR